MALLLVLLIVTAIAIISMGFVARMDSELTCGDNMLMRTQMDQLAESGLDHARGWVLQPQDVDAAYLTGGATAVAQQLVADSQDYYDVNISPDPLDNCTYTIRSNAYRIVGTDKIGRSRLVATLRLDPCVALWANGNLDFRKTWVLCGDLRSGGPVTSLAPQASIDGDAFSAGAGLSGLIVGQSSDVSDVTKLSLKWPPVKSTYTNPDYASYAVSGTLSSTTRPSAIWCCAGDLVLGGNVTIDGMLLVTGNLTIRGNANTIRAAKNLAALYVGGNLVMEGVNGLEIDGLVVVDHDVRISAAAAGVSIRGALFVSGTLTETAGDLSGNGHTAILCGNPAWTAGKLGAALQLDGVRDYINCGTSSAFDLVSRVSVTAWVNTMDAGDGKYHSYVTKGDHTYALQHRHLFGDTSDSIEFFIFDATWQSARVTVNSSFNGGWHHLAGTYDGANVRLYIDGVLVATTPHTGSIALGANLPLYIGGNSEWPDRAYRGAIDDVRLYNVDLSVTTINQVMGDAAVTAGLVARWTLDEPGSGVTIVADPLKAAIVAWDTGIPRCWSPAAGAFYKSLRRQ